MKSSSAKLGNQHSTASQSPDSEYAIIIVATMMRVSKRNHRKPSFRCKLPSFYRKLIILSCRKKYCSCKYIMLYTNEKGNAF